MERTCWNVWAMFVVCAAMASASSAQVFETLTDFNGHDGGNPFLMSLVQGPDGNFYGTAGNGGTYGWGVVFKVTPTGVLTDLYNFCSQKNCPDGAGPNSGLVLGIDGNLYGTTGVGGYLTCKPEGCGTIFKISPEGVLTTVYRFNDSDGFSPYGALIQAADGNFYGTTAFGGRNSYGTVFRITPGGMLRTLHSFNLSDGAAVDGPLIQARDGNFYGTTNGGGRNGNGTVFKITPGGTLTTLYSFCAQPNCDDGAGTEAGLVQAIDGNFYGTTWEGGANRVGTVFKINARGSLTTLHTFQGPPSDGTSPFDGLVQATDGNFYGTTVFGGAGTGDCGGLGCGTIFQITPQGALTTLYSFCTQMTCSDGRAPDGGLIQDTDGKLYGVTTTGGNYYSCGTTGCGTVFSLDMGLGPFVAFVRNPTKAGQMFGILGQGFTGSTNVSLNGNPVPFTIKSDTLITATIPAGGTTGPVTVITPTGTLTSNVPFRVLPQLLSFTPTSGPVGTQVTITGVSLTQANGVGFGDTVPAQFTVNSDTQVTATVPSGAKTGPVGIQTQGGIAISTQTFTVTQ